MIARLHSQVGVLESAPTGEVIRTRVVERVSAKCRFAFASSNVWQQWFDQQIDEICEILVIDKPALSSADADAADGGASS